jgi:hypothetical protein
MSAGLLLPRLGSTPMLTYLLVCLSGLQACPFPTKLGLPTAKTDPDAPANASFVLLGLDNVKLHHQLPKQVIGYPNQRWEELQPLESLELVVYLILIGKNQLMVTVTLFIVFAIQRISSFARRLGQFLLIRNHSYSEEMAQKSFLSSFWMKFFIVSSQLAWTEIPDPLAPTTMINTVTHHSKVAYNHIYTHVKHLISISKKQAIL